MSIPKNRYLSRLALALTLVALAACGWLAADKAAAQNAGDAVVSDVPALPLSADERAWLAAHPVIRVAQDPAWPPIEYADKEGKLLGMAADYLALIEAQLSIRFERVTGLSWQEAYARMQRREIDMTTSVTSTPEREKFWAFTKPYMKIPIVIVASADVTYIADMQELDGKKVAVVDGYAVTDWIPRDFPAIELVRVKNAQEGLTLIQRGDVFAFVENMLVVGYYLARLKMTHLKIVGETPYVNAQSMAVRKDWAMLAGILDKALGAITEPERNEIYRRWLPVRYEHGTDNTRLLQALAAFALIALALGLWIWKLRAEMRNRRKAEAALAASEKKFRGLFETMTQGVVYQNEKGEIISSNPAAERILGLSADQMNGKTSSNPRWRMITEEGKEVSGDQHPSMVALRTGQTIGPVVRGVYSPDAQKHIWLSIVAVPQFQPGDAKPYSVHATFEDITRQKESAEALRQKDATLAKIASQVPGMLFLFMQTPEGGFCLPYASEGIRDVFGLSPQDVSERMDPIVSVVVPDDRERFVRSIEESAKHLSPWRFEFHVQRPGKPVCWLLANSTPEKRQDGAIVWYGYCVDITESKRAQEEIERLNENLERTVAERTRELSDSQLALLNLVDDLNESAKHLCASNTALEAVNRELAAFSHSVSHDLRAPLRAIDGFGRALQEDCAEGLDEPGRDYLARIRRATQTMTGLIDDLLNLSRVTQSELRRTHLDLSQMVETIIEEFRKMNPSRRVQALIPAGISAEADEHLIHIALFNLLENAWKFTVKSPEARIAFGVEHQDDEAVYFVCDNGVGFDPRGAGKLFSAFFRLHGAEEFPGTGIGLSTVQRIIHRHGGRIWAKSQPNQGATFYFTLGGQGVKNDV